MTNKKIIASAVAIAASMLAGNALASSHREAPAIAEDQFADNTDVYAFISPSDPERMVLVADFVPLLLPTSGPNFYRFADSVRYEIAIDNNGDAIPDITYRYEFDTSVGNGATFLYNLGPIASVDDPNLNVKQTYKLWRIDHKKGKDTNTLIAENVPVAPWNVGKNSFPGDSYEQVALGAIKKAGNVSMFAGPRDEPFFVDLHVFDLLGVGGAPTTDGVNVMSLVLEVPVADLAKDKTRPPQGSTAKEAVIGVYARALRQRIRILRKNIEKEPERYEGGWVQVSRLAWPLVNEVIVPLQDKNKYNRTNPLDDVEHFGAYILDPEVPKLLNLVLNAGCPAAPTGGRADIVGLLSPNGTTAADLLRINISQGQTNAESHFPNGRALADDVTDTLLTVACNSGSPLGDQVDANDKAFTSSFPYLASPHSGNP